MDSLNTQLKILIFILILPVLTGCSYKNSRGDKTTLPVVHVTATKSRDKIKFDAYDAALLFKRAADAQKSKKFDEAIENYKKLIAEFSDSDLSVAAMYNMALCYDNLEKYETSIDYYNLYLKQNPSDSDAQDALFRRASAEEKLEKWDDVIKTMDTLLDDNKDLDAVDQIEVHAKKGSAYAGKNSDSLAGYELQKAILIYKNDKTITKTAPDYYYSMAQFKLAELKHNEMRSILLPADSKDLEKILEHKCQLLLDSQYLYTQVIKTGHPEWSAAAAYRTGSLYHHLWEDMLNSDPPKDLNDEESSIYQEILRKKIKVLLKKAVIQWKRTLNFAKRLNLKNHWIESTESDLAKIEKILKIEETVAQDLNID